MRAAYAFALVFAFAACAAPPASQPTPPPPGRSLHPGGVTIDTPPAPPVADLHYIGRFDFSDPVGPTFSWPGSALWTRFSGTTLSVELSGYAWFDVEIDGVRGAPLVTDPGDRVYPLATGLPDGIHDVRLTRRTEAFIGKNQLYGFSGAPLIATPGPGRWIEMVGDSATTGYGVLGDGPDCPYQPATEAETYAWGALAASALGAAHTTIAYAGRGVAQNWGGATDGVVPELWGRIHPDDPASQWTFATRAPDVVVVNLGTNDFWNGDPGPSFVDAYRAFLSEIRTRYPYAWIIAATSSLLAEPSRTIEAGYIAQAVDELDDPEIAILTLAEQQASDGYGCGYHPSPITQEKMALALVDRITELTGWQVNPAAADPSAAPPR